MNPIKLSQQLQETLVSYLTTTFDVNRDGEEPALAAFIQKSMNRPRALFAGPYLELTPPYKTAETLQDLAAEGIVSPQLLQHHSLPLPADAPLYTHQATALRKLCTQERNIVVSSGTGSGKTESFLLPILNDLLIDQTPGVRAVLVYPLNALVNDQLDRLRILLRDTDITFGRYTSELAREEKRASKQMKKEWEEMEPSRQKLFKQYPLPNEVIGRDQIQKQGLLPQILITNYAMLEYLLLRPEDSPLFRQGKWRFVVLDEAHSYAGAKGIEIGLLMRRLKLRLGHESGQMRCIATSATLTDDDAEDACRFAEALFGEEFAPDDIIFGELNHAYIPPAKPRQPPIKSYIHPQFDDLIRNVRQKQWESSDEMALLLNEIGLIAEDELSLADKYVDPPHLLWEVLRGNEDLTRLRNYMAEKGQPVEVSATADKLFHEHDLSTVQQQDALYHLVELAAMARPAFDQPSLLPARYHLFVRPPQGIWACLNPTCSKKQPENQWSNLFAIPRKTCDVCEAPVYPLVVCRTCGQVYVRLQKEGKKYLAEAAMEDDAENHYVTWRPIRKNLALREDEGDDEDTLVEQAGESVLKQSEMTLCVSCQQKVRANGKCGCANKSKHIVKLHLLQKEQLAKKGEKRGVKTETVTHINECGRCHSRALGDTEIATEITMNALTPLAVLTEDLYQELPESSQAEIRRKAGNGRKLLSFYDSRQGAARFAAFVQDIVNQQAYRRIIREAITTTATNTYWPDLEGVSEKCLDLALKYRIAHNDSMIKERDLPRHSPYLNQRQKKQLVVHMRKRVFAEITTQLRSRQSLEALGLMTVQYFEPDHVPDFTDLAGKIGLTSAETRALVEYLLDDLRRGKVVVLPDGVNRDDPIFGRNKFSPRLARHDAGQNEVAWIGKTRRHRRRQLVRKILQHKGMVHDETAVVQVLTDILNWLIDKSDLLDTSRPEDGYQLRHDRLFFHANTQWYRCNQCQRLNSRGSHLPCPHAHCQGSLQPVNIHELDGNNFYYDNLRQELTPMRIEEHTAQLHPDKGRTYQNKFKTGEINMLSCSTTFEMGIDLGDLQAVVMSNIPPTVANYKQRAGRAGRRVGGTAFILAWASNRPHDQTYFKMPAEIISGKVRVPFLDVQNAVIIQRHVNAIILSEFLRYCASQREYDATVGSFFDEQIPGGSYYPLLPQWVQDREDDLLDLLARYATAVNQAIDPSHALTTFTHDLRQKGYEHYHTVTSYYKETREDLAKKQLDFIMQGRTQQEMGALPKEIERYGRLLERFRNENIINYLSDRGALPSYSFPLHTVELRIPPHLLPAKQLRLQRNLQQAIREYAPGQEVVADKRIWKSNSLDFFGQEPKIFAYHICPTCKHLRLETTPGKPLEQTDHCPICYTLPKRNRQLQNNYIQPDGFRASNNSGQAAGQYVNRPFNLMRSALFPGSVKRKSISSILEVGYDREGTLLYVNEGFKGGGFRICQKCGKQVRKGHNKCDGKLYGQPCSGTLSRNDSYMLGFKQNTDTLHLELSGTTHVIEPDDLAFWLSLKYAFLQGASRALQIERRDIDGVLFPKPSGSHWQQTIVLYDAVPGGAGHVKRIQEEMSQVVASALEIVNCDCESSCYRCLREYTNQWEHHLLERKRIFEFLRALDADLQQLSQEPIIGLHPVVAIDQTAWLWEQIEGTQQELVLFVNQVVLEQPISARLTWLDLLQQLLQKGINIRLYLHELPDQTSGDGEAILLATHLRLLLRKGLDLRQTNRQLPWLAVIDPHATTSAAIKTSNDKAITLGDGIPTKFLVTNHSQAVKAISETIKRYRARSVEYADLDKPANTYVREVKRDGKKHNEEDYFSEFYARPVQGMIVNDRYLDTKEKVLNRLGAHIDLAHRHGGLEWVEVYTIHTRQGQNEQKQAISQLKSQYPEVNIKFKIERHIAHDRYIELTYTDNHKARVIIGLGLDFIEPNGSVRETFLVFQDKIT